MFEIYNSIFENLNKYKFIEKKESIKHKINEIKNEIKNKEKEYNENALIQKNIDNNNCSKSIISKIYYDINDVKNDNYKLLFFDKELDDTPLYLLDKILQTNTDLDNESIKNMLMQELDNIYPEYNSFDKQIILENILQKGKLVQDGNYALLKTEWNQVYLRNFKDENNGGMGLQITCDVKF